MQAHRIATAQNGSAMLYVGAESWRWPIPLLRRAGGWRFDSKSGRKEIVAGRIATKQAAAESACQVLFDAQAL